MSMVNVDFTKLQRVKNSLSSFFAATSIGTEIFMDFTFPFSTGDTQIVFLDAVKSVWMVVVYSCDCDDVWYLLLANTGSAHDASDCQRNGQIMEPVESQLIA